jgi:hypothetical protein
MTMPLWRLIPVDLETAARETAKAATRFRPGKGARIPPWTCPEMVRAEIIDSPIYSVEGRTEILEPSFG